MIFLYLFNLWTFYTQPEAEWQIIGPLPEEPTRVGTKVLLECEYVEWNVAERLEIL